MLTTRILPSPEWFRLEGTESAPFAHADPEANVNPLVVEDGELIVGTWTLTAYHVVEGLWIHPDYRQRIGVARRIVRDMRRFAECQGVTQALTFAVSDEVERMLEHFGATRVPAVDGHLPIAFVVPFRQERPCQPPR